MNIENALAQDESAPLYAIRHPLQAMLSEERLEDAVQYLLEKAPQVLFTSGAQLAFKVLQFARAPEIGQLVFITKYAGADFLLAQCVKFLKKPTPENKRLLVASASVLIHDEFLDVKVAGRLESMLEIVE